LAGGRLSSAASHSAYQLQSLCEADHDSHAQRGQAAQRALHALQLRTPSKYPRSPMVQSPLSTVCAQ
jgi:hypothetical protein